MTPLLVIAGVLLLLGGGAVLAEARGLAALADWLGVLFVAGLVMGVLLL